MKAERVSRVFGRHSYSTLGAANATTLQSQAERDEIEIEEISRQSDDRYFRTLRSAPDEGVGPAL